MHPARVPPFVLHHCCHYFAGATVVAVDTVKPFDGDFRCQPPSHKPRHCLPDKVSAMIFLFDGWHVALSNGELLGRLPAVDSKLVLLPEQVQRPGIVAQCGRRDLLQRDEFILVRVRTYQRHTSI